MDIYLWTVQKAVRRRWSSRVFDVCLMRLRRWRWTFRAWAVRRARTIARTTAPATAWTVACRCWRFSLWHLIDWHDRWTLCISTWRTTSIDGSCAPITPGHFFTTCFRTIVYKKVFRLHYRRRFSSSNIQSDRGSLYMYGIRQYNT